MAAKQTQKKKAARSGTSRKTTPGKKTTPKASSKAKKSKTPPRKPKKKPDHPWVKTLAGFFFLVGVVFATGVTVHFFFPPEAPKAVEEPKARAHRPAEKPTYEVYSDESLAWEEPEPKQPEPVHSKPKQPKEPEQKQPEAPPPAEHHPFPERRPMVAIIIDDIGYNRVLARKLMALDIPITFSVLPHSPHNRELAAEAHGKGIEIMLHLPMEPMEYPKVNPGPGALLVSMDVDHMLEVLYENLEDVPYVVGVNNHMGSRMTTVSTRMYQIFTVLKKKDLFFIDSKTSAQSLCKPSARLLQVPFAERDVFLDHSLNKKTIRKQLKRLIRVAQKTGQAIGIGHPHKETYQVLLEERDLLESSVRLVRASELVEPLG